MGYRTLCGADFASRGPSGARLLPAARAPPPSSPPLSLAASGTGLQSAFVCGTSGWGPARGSPRPGRPLPARRLAGSIPASTSRLRAPSPLVCSCGAGGCCWGDGGRPRTRLAHPPGRVAGAGSARHPGRRGEGQPPSLRGGTGSIFSSSLPPPFLQKLAFYSKMQEAPESGSSASASSSFSSHPAASIKEEDCSPEKERPPEAEYISSRCVLFTYFQGDISAVVDEHFSRALSQPSSFSLGSAKAARNAGSWRGERAGGARRAAGLPPRAPSSPPPAAGARRAAPGSRLSRAGAAGGSTLLGEKKDKNRG